MKVVQPGTTTVVWQGSVSTRQQVEGAVGDSRAAFASWSATPTEQRVRIADQFGQIATDRADEISRQISLETGKPRWEADAEAKLIAAKVKLSIQAFDEHCRSQEIDLPQGTGRTVFRPTGVMAVLGPFNFPAHLPNGHIVPALIAGNTVVFKPSEMTAGTGALLCELWEQAGLPPGVLRIVHGDRAVGEQLVRCDVDGILFTGSFAGGEAIHRSLAGRPHVLLALEMGGNNPLVIHGAKDLDAAAYLAVLSAYVTAGQRCTCARRLILPEGRSVQPLLDKITRWCDSIRVGMPGETPEPFMGPVISIAAADRVLQTQAELVARGAKVLVESRRLARNRALITPALIDTTDLIERSDEEVFGPLLQVIRVQDFDEAVEQANRTAYGLAASLLSDDADLYRQFQSQIRAGVVNWNQATIGASGRLPFGGLGRSGNHRPSGFFAANYCSDATAMLEKSVLEMPASVAPGIGMFE